MQQLCCVRTRQQFSASLDYFVTSSPPYLHQFSTISGGNCITTGLDVVTAACPFQSSSGKVVGSFSEYDYFEVFKTQVDDKTIKVGEQAAEDRGKGIRLVVVKRRIHFVNYVVNCGVGKFTCLT